MESNVVELFRAKAVEPDNDPVVDFMVYSLLPWAMENNLDVNSMQFKLNGATIMTCLQGMLLNDI